MQEADFQQQLTSLGLDQYYDQFVAEAFDSWSVLAQITESDLDALQVKRGHRRTLQLAIADYQRENTVRAPSERSTESSEASTAPTEDRPRVKRKYVRHPKVTDTTLRDACAPEKALTGYVLFANYTREQLKDEKHSFQEIAKIVGERWRCLSKDEKNVFLRQSKELKEVATRRMDEYKRTSEYREHQRYLIDFRATQMGMSPRRRYSDAEDQREPRPRRSPSAGQQSPGAEPMTNKSSRAGYFAPVQSPTLLEPPLHMGPSAYGSSVYQPASPHQAQFRPQATQAPPLHDSFATRQLPPLFPGTPYERRRGPNQPGPNHQGPNQQLADRRH